VKLAGRVPVEPLDEERLTNIERRVVAGAVDAAIRRQDLGAPRRHAAQAFTALALVAAGVVGWLLHAPPRAPAVAEPAPIRVDTTAQRSVVDIGDARIESDPATVFAVTRPDGAVVVALARGKVELEVDSRGERPPLIVRAGDTDVIVVGTHFTVDYGDGRGEVDVQVREGVVRVVHQRQETRVAAGQAWRTRAGVRALAAAADRDAGPAPASPAPASPAATPAAPSGTLPVGDTAVAVGPLPEVLRDRKAAVPDAPALAIAPPPRAPTPPRRPDAARPRPSRPLDPRADVRAAIRAHPVEPALDVGPGNAASTIARYYDIAAHRAGDEASRAFYSIAVVKHRLGQNADALDVLDAYSRRFRDGKEYSAVLWLRLRILCLDKIEDRCRAAAYTYLHDTPDGPAADIAQRITRTE
jgi:hypothetical protein